MYSDLIPVHPLVLGAAQWILALAMLLAGWRVLKGPDTANRVVALDLLASLMMAQFVLMVLRSGFVSYLDVSTAIAIISFIATVAFARYLENRENPS